MAIVFSRSTRSIEADGYRRSGIVLGLGFAFAAAWALWFFAARVAVVEVAETARLEVDQAAHGIEAPVGGRIVSSRLVLGEEVHEGDVLLALDSEPMRLALEQEKAKQLALTHRIAALVQELEAEEKALTERRGSAKAQSSEADARRREAMTAAALAQEEKVRAARLRAEGLASEADAVKARAEADQRRAAAEGASFGQSRLEAGERASETERRARLARLRGEAAQLEGEKQMSEALLKQLAYEIDRRQIRAPITGRLGEVATLRVGAVVKEGDKLGAIIPIGTIRIVGEFRPSVLGRVRTGQRATMRPEGFAWTEYGLLRATVRRVASEPRSGHIRVELEIEPRAHSAIPIEHGLPGTLEIETDRISPVVLVLRIAGGKLATPLRPAERPGEKGHEETAPRP